ncbi:MAG: bifunctional riboflavin kinase/FAD synthetase [Waterburya sp.]
MNKISNYTNCKSITHFTSQALVPTAIAIGKFDGLHRGHQQVIQPVLDRARKQETKNRNQYGENRRQGHSSFPHTSPITVTKKRVRPTVLAFNPHPQEFFQGKPYPLLTPLNEKAQQLISWGIEQLVLLPFNKELTALSPQDFVEKILVQQLHARMISVGEDFCFGKQRSGTARDLQAIATKLGIPVTIVPNFTYKGERISSSSIRQALAKGDPQRVSALLGRPYTLSGNVIKGQQLDRIIGFPTANIHILTNKRLPRHGVYAVRVFIKIETANSCSLPDRLLPVAIGVMNIGCCSEIKDIQQLVKVHLLNWSGDLSGKNLTIQLEKFLRPEQKFASLENFKAQKRTDCAIASSLLG